MGTAVAVAPRAAVDTLGWYLAMVNAAPMLTAEQELDLARRFREQDDQEAARQLVISHLRLVVRMARGYLGYGLDFADLIQEGTIGLMRAVKRYEPDRGVRLAPFAAHFIRAHIQEFVLRNWRIVKVATTKAQRKLFFKLRQHKQRLEPLRREEVECIAATLDVSAEDVEIMDGRLSGTDMSFGICDEDGLMNRSLRAARTLPEPGSSSLDDYEAHEEASTQSRRLERALDVLDARSRDIIVRRWLRDDKVTLDKLGEYYGISKERVRQIESSALARLRQELEHEDPLDAFACAGRRVRSTAGAKIPSPAVEHLRPSPSVDPPAARGRDLPRGDAVGCVA